MVQAQCRGVYEWGRGREVGEGLRLRVVYFFLMSFSLMVSSLMKIPCEVSAGSGEQ